MIQTPIPSSSKAYAAYQARDILKPYAYDLAELKPYEILVEITHCGLCHTDLYMINNSWNRSSYPLVPGHEIIGKVIKRGNRATKELDSRVGVGWIYASCLHCAECSKGQINICQHKTPIYSQGRFGGFATHIVADSRFSFLIPKSLESAHAAPLLCAGSTVFAPLTRFKMQDVAIIGIGGLGHLAIQFAKALGYKVTALSHSHFKEQDAFKLGAQEFYTFEKLPSPQSVDFILCTVDANLDWNQILSLLKPNGTLCFVSRPLSGITFDPMYLVSTQRTICGSNNATLKEMEEMLIFAEKNRTLPWIEEMPLSHINEAIQRLLANNVRYRVVLKIQN